MIAGGSWCKLPEKRDVPDLIKVIKLIREQLREDPFESEKVLDLIKVF